MIIAKKVRLIPTPEQEQMLMNHAGAMRWAYNYCKRLSDNYYRVHKRKISQLDLQKQFTKIKKCPAYAWLNEINAQVPKQASKDYALARQRSFKKYGHGFATRFKSKRDLHQGFYANYERLIVKKRKVDIQSIGEVKTSSQLPRGKKPSNPRVTYDGQFWWLSVGFREEFQPQELTDTIVGVDVGLSKLLVTSDGKREKNINKTTKVKKLLKRKKSAQRDMSRRFVKGRQKQSANYEKAKAEHLRLSRKLTNIRNNHIHQATARLVKAKPMKIVVEDLNISDLMKNKKVARAFAYQKLNFFFQCLSYKCEKYGIEFVKADRWFASSKLCSSCERKYDHKCQPEGQWSLKIREWTCVHCKAHHDRDVNAAINLSRWVA